MKAVYSIYIRDKDGQFIDRLNDFTKLHILLTLNDVGSWSLSSKGLEKCPFAPGEGIVVSRNGKYFYSGVVTEITDNYETFDGMYSWQVSGKNDLEYLNRRICYVDPSTGRTDTVSHYVDTGTLSDVVRRLIMKNIGNQALSYRREPIIEDHLQSQVGGSASVSLRFQNLLKVVTSLVAGKGFNIRSNWDNKEKKIYYDIFQGRDLENSIVFTDQIRNITAAQYLASVPACNFILAGGTGEMTERQFADAQNDGSISKWGRIEKFQDARNQGEVVSYASEVLAENSANTVGYSCTAADDENSPQYGIDYELGDFVGMKVFGTFVVAEVQQCEIEISDGNETFEPRFGTVAIGKLKNIFTQLADLRKDVNELLGTEIE